MLTINNILKLFIFLADIIISFSYSIFKLFNYMGNIFFSLNFRINNFNKNKDHKNLDMLDDDKNNNIISDNANENDNNNYNNYNKSFSEENLFGKLFGILFGKLFSKLFGKNLLEVVNLKTINIKVVLSISIIFLSFIALIIYILFGLEISVAFLLFFILIFFFILYFPKINKNRNDSEISRELPFALRHMVTELRSGKGLHDTILSIANSNYGPLSYEFSYLVEEIKYGEKTEKALLNMSTRVSSDGLNRTIQQILGTLRTGGNLAHNLNIIAEDVSFDLQIKLKDYSQKLNAFIMIYTFLAILGPVIILIMLMAASTIMGDIIPSNVLLIIYILFFPMVVVFMGLMIKRLEPTL